MKPWPPWVVAAIAFMGLSLPFIVDPPTKQGQALLYSMSGALLLAALGLSNPVRFKWALKLVGALFVVAYSALFASETVAWWNGKPFFGDEKSGTSLASAMKFLAGILVPAIYFVLKGGTGGLLDFMFASRSARGSTDGEVQ